MGNQARAYDTAVEVGAGSENLFVLGKELTQFVSESIMETSACCTEANS